MHHLLSSLWLFSYTRLSDQNYCTLLSILCERESKFLVQTSPNAIKILTVLPGQLPISIAITLTVTQEVIVGDKPVRMCAGNLYTGTKMLMLSSPSNHFLLLCFLRLPNRGGKANQGI